MWPWSGKLGAMDSGGNSCELQSWAGWAACLPPPPRNLLPALFVQMLMPISSDLSWTDGFLGRRPSSVLEADENQLHPSRCGKPDPCVCGRGADICLASASGVILAGPGGGKPIPGE